MRKYTRTESAPEVISPEAHSAIQKELTKLGKTSARDLSDRQRESFRLAVDESEDEC